MRARHPQQSEVVDARGAAGGYQQPKVIKRMAGQGVTFHDDQE